MGTRLATHKPHYPERSLIVAILWAFCRWSRSDAEWSWNDLAIMARNMRKNNQRSVKAVNPTKPLSAGAELQLISSILSTPYLRALRRGKATKQSVARALQIVWRQAPDIAIFSSRIDRLRSAARVNGTQLADELVHEAKRKIYRNFTTSADSVCAHNIKVKTL